MRSLGEEIAAGESAVTEFRHSIPRDPMRYPNSVIAFTNIMGGRIIVGVHDDGMRRIRTMRGQDDALAVRRSDPSD